MAIHPPLIEDGGILARRKLKDKADTLKYINKNILGEDEQGNVIRHILTYDDDHEIIIKNPSGYIEIVIKNIGDDKTFLYSIHHLNSLEG